ncbi:amino acid ABC transporter ATP-binding protein [Vibrio palustris]|uniref:Putative amino-acid import ATP-binding protein YxeO n=1 Tax=Vibrio palustris TaxID=1918946 RepID=A0A1R4B7K8_9VIBR|nr:amino acid ABC transporter ATP-binding protein [Vibrio palustris]SJL84851.1 putative amino-acid import ATP-binding protein YxeO [Vibrio palustris]
MIKLNNIHKKFGDSDILKGINLEIQSGEIIVVIGSSGTGKSTLLRCVNFLEQPDRGTIQIGDVTINAAKHTSKEVTALRRQTGFVFQNYALFSHMTAQQNIAEGLITVQGWDKRKAYEQAQTILNDIGLGDKGESYPAALSGGQQQRVGIGRAMALKPELLLFDEPTSALDPEWVGEVLALMKRLAKEHQTMLVVTHEMQFARDVADRVIFMAEGSIVEQGSPQDIFDNPQDPKLKKFLNQVGIE